MKNLLTCLGLAMLFSSCSTGGTFYQLYKVKASDNVTKKNDVLVYEDDNCTITYNLWGSKGNLNFKLYNKSTETLYLNMEDCFLVNNGMAQNYYLNRVFTMAESEEQTTSNSVVLTNSANKNNATPVPSMVVGKSRKSKVTTGKSVAYQEEKIVGIPSHTYKMITVPHRIVTALYKDCNVNLFPIRKEVASTIFEAEKSPVQLSNRLEYKVGKTGTDIHVANDFYISEVTNYPEKMLVEYKYKEVCNQPNHGIDMVKYFKSVAPDQFYIKYNRRTVVFIVEY